MKIEHIQKNFKDYQKVLEREAKTLTGLAIRIRLIVGMDSYATFDNSTIQIGLYPWEAAFNWEIVKRIIRFKFHHEIQHVLSTDSREFASAIEDVADVFASKGVCKKRARELGKWLVNGTEDGRIENLMVILRKGIKKLRDWYRLKEFETTEVSPEDDMTDIELALMNIHSVACRGYLCKGFATHYAGKPVYDVVIDCLEDIKKAVTASTTRGMGDICREMADKLTTLIDAKQEQEIGEGMSEKGQQEVIFVSNKNIENLDKGDKWKEKLNKNSKIIAILEDTDDEQQPGENSEDGIVPDEIIDLRTKKPKKEDNDEESKSSSKGGSGEKSEGDAQQGSNGEFAEGDSEDTDGSSSGSTDGLDEEAGESADSSAGDSAEDASEGESTDLGAESEGNDPGNGKSGSKGKSKGSGKSGKPSVDEYLEKKLDDLEDDLEKSDKIQEEMEGREKARKLQIIKEIQQNGVAERDRNKPDMSNIMLDVEKRQTPYRMPEYHPYDKDRWNSDAPYEVIAKATGIREDVKKALASETEQTIGGLYEGDFDIDNIANLCLGSFDCFKKESTHKDEVHFDITILKDNSGSMGGKVNERCCTAMALLEEIVKGINGISLKIADYSDRKHGIIKDWDDMSGEFNYSWSYYENEDVDGGQYDDVSMDLFASELVARPAATNKMLCILTDGEPCVPREALQEILTRGRQNGVYIMVFFIGYDAERIARNKDRYEDIYGEGCCFAIPYDEDMMNLGDVFVELLRANVKF